jgi:hypothetical protein
MNSALKLLFICLTLSCKQILYTEINDNILVVNDKAHLNEFKHFKKALSLKNVESYYWISEKTSNPLDTNTFISYLKNIIYKRYNSKLIEQITVKDFIITKIPNSIYKVVYYSSIEYVHNKISYTAIGIMYPEINNRIFVFKNHKTIYRD